MNPRELPIRRVSTTYARIGDAPVALAALHVIWLVGLAFRRRRAAR